MNFILPLVLSFLLAPSIADYDAPVVNRFAPEFPGGEEAFTEFLTKELAYPELATEYAIEGTVVVKVEVSATGAVKAIGVSQPLFEPLDRAALKAAAALPRFLPAVTNGVAHARTMMIPFRFRLQ